MAITQYMSYEEILRDPLIHLRIRVGKLLKLLSFPDGEAPQGVRMKAEGRDALWSELLELTEGNPLVRHEIQSAREALEKGEIYKSPNLGREETQLVWGIALAYAALNPERIAGWFTAREKKPQPLNYAPLWNQLIETYVLQGELYQTAFVSSEELRQETRLRWGVPGSWFYCHTEVDLVNMDLAHGLTLGIPTTRPVLFHEIGHAKYTTAWSPQLMEAIKQVKEYLETFRRRKATPDEYKDYRRLAYYVNLRQRFENSAEDNMVNRFAAMLGQKHPQDYGIDLNYLQTYVTGIAHHDIDISPYLEMPENVQLQTLLQNALEKAASEAKGDEEISNKDRFQTLSRAVNMAFFVTNGFGANTDDGWRSILVEKDKLPVIEGMAADEVLADIYDRCDGGQGKISHLQPVALTRLEALDDENTISKLWERRMRLIDDLWNTYAKDLIDELMEEFAQELDQQFEIMRQIAAGQLPNGTDGITMGDGDGIAIEGIEGKAPKADLPDGPGSGPGSKEEAGGKEEGEGAGALKKRQERTIEQILKEGEERREAEKRAREAQEKARREAEASALANSSKTIDDLRAGNFAEYEALVEELAPFINQVAQLIIKMRREQLQVILSQRKAYGLVPEDQDLERFEMERHQDLIMKRAMGEQPREEDYKRFRLDVEIPDPTKVDLCIMIDGSGSMGGGKNGGSPMEIAMLSSIILYEAAQIAGGINVYVSVWGVNDEDMIRNKLILAKPGDNRTEIGARMEAARDGTNSGTDMAPSFKVMAEMLMKQAPQDTAAGFSHWLVFTDGHIYDGELSAQYIHDLFRNCKKMTLDFAVIGKSKAAVPENNAQTTALDEMVTGIRENGLTRNQVITVTHSFEPGKVASQMINHLYQRMRQCRSLIPDINLAAQQKKSQYRRAVAAIQARQKGE